MLPPRRLEDKRKHHWEQLHWDCRAFLIIVKVLLAAACLEELWQTLDVHCREKSCITVRLGMGRRGSVSELS